jgi:hypothetical protein
MHRISQIPHIFKIFLNILLSKINYIEANHNFFAYYPIFVQTFELLKLYALKIQGKAKIPDYVQLRDEQFTLLAYFRLDRPEKALTKIGLSDSEAQIIQLLQDIPFGKVHEFEIASTK